MIDGLLGILSETPLEKLWEALERFPTVRDLPIGETRYTPRKAQAITGEAVRTIGAEQMNTSEQRRMRRALVRACEKLAHSAWGSIDLNSEMGEQVRDFIIDEIIDRPVLEVISAARMCFVAFHVIVTPRALPAQFVLSPWPGVETHCSTTR